MPSASHLRPLFAASLLALACTVAVPAAARDAAGAQDHARRARTNELELSEPSAAWTAGTAPAADCTRTRRKLWQPEQGWVVKSVTTCH